VEFDYVPVIDTNRWSRLFVHHPVAPYRRFEIRPHTPARKNRASGICVDRAVTSSSVRVRARRPVWDLRSHEGCSTRPHFGWYFARLVFKWIKKQGGPPLWKSKRRAENSYGFIEGKRFAARCRPG
jgi:hypothetical protein